MAERALALSYADGRHRAALESLLALDDALAQVLRTTTTPAVGQLRLAWWREALAALDHAPPYQHPRRVWFLPEMPLAGTNKVDRRRLAELAGTLLGTDSL